MDGRLEDLSETAVAVLVETGEPLGKKLVELIEHSDSEDLLRGLQELCETDRYLLSVPLWDVARVATERGLVLLRQRLASASDTEQHDFVMSANNLALRLRYLRQSEAGLEVIEEAVTTCRELVERDTEKYLPDLAATLNNLGLLLGDADRPEEALKTLEESLRFSRELVALRGDEELESVARALTNLSVRLNSLGRHEEALGNVEEAVEIFRRIVPPEPGPMLSFFAASLHNLGKSLGHMERSEEAAAAATEAVAIQRSFAEYQRETYSPNVATCLYSLGSCLEAADRHEAALGAQVEACEIRRQLLTERPGVFFSAYAISLRTLAHKLVDMGRTTAARTLVEESRRLLAPILPEIESRADSRTRSALSEYSDLCQEMEGLPVG